MMGPGTLGVAAVNINVLVNTYLAAAQEGAVSWLGYAFRLMYLPIGLFGVSIATAALPDLSRHAHDGDATAIRRGVSSAIRLMLMLNVPAMIGLIALAEPIVALLYQRGKFTHADTLATAAALRFYAPGLIGYSIVKIASPTFYSLGNSRTPVIVSVTSVTVNLVLNILLFRVMVAGEVERIAELAIRDAAFPDGHLREVLAGHRRDGALIRVARGIERRPDDEVGEAIEVEIASCGEREAKPAIVLRAGDAAEQAAVLARAGLHDTLLDPEIAMSWRSNQDVGIAIFVQVAGAAHAPAGASF
jgi:hypothetical protein